MDLDRPLLMIPGPIEFSPAVLQASSEPSLSHVSPEFINIFSEALGLLRQVRETSLALSSLGCAHSLALAPGLPHNHGTTVCHNRFWHPWLGHGAPPLSLSRCCDRSVLILAWEQVATNLTEQGASLAC